MQLSTITFVYVPRERSIVKSFIDWLMLMVLKHRTGSIFIFSNGYGLAVVVEALVVVVVYYIYVTYMRLSFQFVASCLVDYLWRSNRTNTRQEILRPYHRQGEFRVDKKTKKLHPTT